MTCLSRLGVFAAAMALAGCATGPGLPRWDVGGTGWRVSEMPAAWTPAGGDGEWTGELLVAEGPAGERFVQFSKQGIPVVTARSGAVGWEIGSAMSGRKRQGRGEPPSGLLWFLVTGNPPEEPRSSGWHRVLSPDGGWLLHSDRGERLEAAGP